jgi:hypothetical protein
LKKSRVKISAVCADQLNQPGSFPQILSSLTAGQPQFGAFLNTFTGGQLLNSNQLLNPGVTSSSLSTIVGGMSNQPIGIPANGLPSSVINQIVTGSSGQTALGSKLANTIQSSPKLSAFVNQLFPPLVSLFNSPG